MPRESRLIQPNRANRDLTALTHSPAPATAEELEEENLPADEVEEGGDDDDRGGDEGNLVDGLHPRADVGPFAARNGRSGFCGVADFIGVVRPIKRCCWLRSSRRIYSSGHVGR